MTEEEWVGSTDPQKMLEFLGGQAGDRKLRLFACACCRRIWERLNSVSRKAVEVAEQHADRVAHHRHMARLFVYADAIGLNSSARVVVASDADRAARDSAIFAARHAASDAVIRDLYAVERAEAAAQADLLRDICNPFGPATFDPSYRTPSVVTLAATIYGERAFDRLPILADTLEETGCTDADFIAHLRGPGPHIRGCWPLDLLLGKESWYERG